jgi:hypothetical protein
MNRASTESRFRVLVRVGVFIWYYSRGVMKSAESKRLAGERE